METYTLPRKTVDMLTCTAQVVAEHLEHGYASSADVSQLRQAVQEVESVTKPTMSAKPRDSAQQMLWGD